MANKEALAEIDKLTQSVQCSLQLLFSLTKDTVEEGEAAQDCIDDLAEFQKKDGVLHKLRQVYEKEK